MIDRRTFIKSLLTATVVPLHYASARMLLGLHLRPAGSALVKKVETSCGKPLDVQYEDMEPRGSNKILPDGTPSIRINPSYKSMLEELLVHEIGHLQLALEGFPRYDWFFDAGAPIELQSEQRHLPDWLAIHILDPLEHRIFYPRLKRIGYRPDSWRIEEMNTVIANGTYGPDIIAPYETAARYCQVAMELGEHVILRQMAAWYKRQGWSDGLALGSDAYSRVRNISGWTPLVALTAFVEVANVLLRPLGWTVKSQGILPKTLGRVKENYGQIQIRRAAQLGARWETRSPP